MLRLNQAAHLDNDMIERLASYYSAQNPVRGSPQNPAGVAAGKILYQRGVADKVLSCMACHGTNAAGLGTIPRLAGQRQLSLKRQLGYFATNQRANTLMQQEATNLTAQQRSEVADYLAAQTESNPSPAAQTGPVTQRQFEKTVAVCSACHEFGGRGALISPAFTFPRLAGQQKDYLVAQIKAFRDKTRADPRARAYMWDQAAHLDNAMIERLASYYSAQNPVRGSPQNPAGVAAGKILYQSGVADKVLSCMACHGTNAAGLGTIPRLAGQRQLSLERQLGYFATNLRANTLMQQEATNLTAPQRSEIADYLASQTESNPRPAAQTGPVTQRQFSKTVAVCSACHEFGGRGARISPAFTFPRLAGQQKDYLVAQLKAFRDKTRADSRARAYMWDQAAHLDNAMIERLASYYSTQNPVPGSPQNPAAVAAGMKIYQQGIPDKIPPCMACHLTTAQGLGTTPRLAGQRRLILARRLEYFAVNAPPNGIMMHKEAKHLTVQQINDISTYLASLHFSDR